MANQMCHVTAWHSGPVLSQPGSLWNIGKKLPLMHTLCALECRGVLLLCVLPAQGMGPPQLGGNRSACGCGGAQGAEDCTLHTAGTSAPSFPHLLMFSIQSSECFILVLVFLVMRVFTTAVILLSIQRGNRELQFSRDRTLTGRGWGPAHTGDGSSPDPLLQAPRGAHSQHACSATVLRASQKLKQAWNTKPLSKSSPGQFSLTGNSVSHHSYVYPKKEFRADCLLV